MQQRATALLTMGLLSGLISAANADTRLGLKLPSLEDSTITLTLKQVPSDDDFSEHLQVFTGGSDRCCDNRLPIAGDYSLAGSNLTFTPDYPYISEQTYTVLTGRYTPGVSMRSQQHEFSLSQHESTDTPTVTAIYPSGDTIPENTLRFHIHFSHPMEPHRSTEFIHLMDADGHIDDKAFMSFKQELWSEDRTRLTLLMDPGRIKRGVAQNIALGPSLREGSQFSLIISDGWRRANSDESIPAFRKEYVITNAIRTQPTTAAWDIQPIRSATFDPIVMSFDRPFDHASALRSIHVLDAMGRTVHGSVSLSEHEKKWQFEPLQTWQSTPVQIVIDPLIEDVAGNNFNESLDHNIDVNRQRNDQNAIRLTLTPHSP